MLEGYCYKPVTIYAHPEVINDLEQSKYQVCLRQAKCSSQADDYIIVQNVEWRLSIYGRCAVGIYAFQVERN